MTGLILSAVLTDESTETAAEIPSYAKRRRSQCLLHSETRIQEFIEEQEETTQ